MQKKKEVDQENKGAKNSRENKEKGSKAVHVDPTPATEKAKPKAGSALHNEGTNVSYDEQR